MKRERAEQFNREVEAYRRVLLFLAKQRDWKSFQDWAKSLFDYVESVEAGERERRFFGIFSSVLAALALTVVVVFGIEPAFLGDWMGLRNALIMGALGGSGFELVFYYDFRVYVKVRMAHYQERRIAFIRGLEGDFREYLTIAEQQGV
ncbi:MAG: hypothetical protein M0042_03270 [Nitrospiraceae bacterium]|nr:hypothetical protein [Nitrospiraceae bacterium]